jgi:dihydrofolate reductase
MGSLIYSAISSLDGYTADADGNFRWAAPDEEVHAFVNELERPIGTYLYGRRMYDTMSYWETAVDHAPVSQAYADIWRAADKIVYSRTLTSVQTARTRLEREFVPDAVAELKQSSATDMSIGGAELGGQALNAGLVDELHLFLVPAVVGGGKRSLPDGLTTRLTLRDQHTFASGFVHLHYEVTS